ncbi:unnamed protein product [Adineta ricciae]|uniref:Tc1-like transposase DDE domain-containing protein n=1 Tax=Adineta ricciae TaxID=249248 RepID=A0A814C8L9_ADIRI|nr:unnamed protein product [Adineta ricciae]CAF1398911.1 unnamed protein product [Adineta ricciae]
MVSDVLTAHPDNPLFQRSQNEWAAVVTKYHELLEYDGGQCIERSASGSIQVGFESYFDNDGIINQFTRLFKILPFKKAYAKQSFMLLWAMLPNTRCKIDQMSYSDKNGKQHTVDCFFTTGENKGQSKGLLILAKELGISVPPKAKLEEIKQLLNAHEAFRNISKLKTVARTYGIAISFSPKFHCELNPIEGLWAHSKQYIRRRTD